MNGEGPIKGFRLPGLFLLIAAGLNIIAGVVLVGVGGQGHMADYRRIEEGLKRDFPGQHKEMEASGWQIQRWIWNTSTGCIAMGLGGLISGGVAIAGVWGIWRSGKPRTAIIGSVMMTLPGFSPTVCIAIGPLAALWMILTILDESGQLPNQSP